VRVTERRVERSRTREQMPGADWVAVVDDHAGLRASLTRAFRVYGIAAESFDSAEEYLRLGHPARPCCLVLDVHLPGMSGLELQRELMARDPSPPAVIFISALTDTLRSDALASGACGFLQKPFAMEDLLELVRPYLTASI